MCTSCETGFRLYLGKCICNSGHLEETKAFFYKLVCKNPCDNNYYGDD